VAYTNYLYPARWGWINKVNLFIFVCATAVQSQLFSLAVFFYIDSQPSSNSTVTKMALLQATGSS